MQKFMRVILLMVCFVCLGACKMGLMTYRNGYILDNEGVTVGNYANGYIFDNERNIRGYYSNGYIYDKNYNIIGNYANGYVKDGKMKEFVQ